jgi:hypothetical protein
MVRCAPMPPAHEPDTDNQTSSATRLKISVPAGKTMLALGKVMGTYTGIEGVTQGHVFLDAQATPAADITAAKAEVDEALEGKIEAIDDAEHNHSKTPAAAEAARNAAREHATKEKAEIDETGKESNLALQAATHAVMQALEGSVAIYGHEDVIAGSKTGATFVAGKKGVYVGAGIEAGFKKVDVVSSSDPAPKGTPAVESVKEDLEKAEHAAAEAILIFECVNVALELAAVIAGSAKDPLFALEVMQTIASLGLTWGGRIAGEHDGTLTLHSKGPTEIFSEATMSLAAKRVLALLAPYTELTGMLGAEVKGGLTAGVSAGVAAKLFGGVTAEVMGLCSAGLVARRGKAEVVGKQVEIGATHTTGLFQSATEEVEINATHEIKLAAQHGATLELLHDGHANVRARDVTVVGQGTVAVTTNKFAIAMDGDGITIAACDPIAVASVAERAAEEAYQAAAAAARTAYDVAFRLLLPSNLSLVALAQALRLAKGVREQAIAAAATARQSAIASAAAVMPNIAITSSGVTLQVGVCKLEVKATGITIDAGTMPVQIKGGGNTLNINALGIQQG